MHRKIMENASFLDAYVAGKNTPITASTFLAFACELHGLLYRDIEGAVGRFRQPGEDTTFGAVGVGQGLKGAAHDQIVPRLTKLFDSLSPAWPHREAAAHNAARFLHGFLVIHPFTDGNGRIGRVLTSCLVRDRSIYELAKLKFKTARDRKRYLDALKYADRRTDPNGVRERNPRDPFCFLARWLEASLRDPREPLEEEGPV
jgi:Fic family protein